MWQSVLTNPQNFTHEILYNGPSAKVLLFENILAALYIPVDARRFNYLRKH